MKKLFKLSLLSSLLLPLLLVIICAAAIAQYPLLAIGLAIIAARVVYHINKEGKA